jgi:hypothetical protein
MTSTANSNRTKDGSTTFLGVKKLDFFSSSQRIFQSCNYRNPSKTVSSVHGPLIARFLWHCQSKRSSSGWSKKPLQITKLCELATCIKVSTLNFSRSSREGTIPSLAPFSRKCVSSSGTYWCDSSRASDFCFCVTACYTMVDQISVLSFHHVELSSMSASSAMRKAHFDQHKARIANSSFSALYSMLLSSQGVR